MSPVLTIEDPSPADFSPRILDILNDAIRTDNPIPPESAANSLHDIYTEHAQTPESGDPHAPENADKDARYLNLSAYIARLHGLGLVNADVQAVWALSDALEGAYTPVRGAPDTFSLDPSAVDKYTYKFAAAAAWITHAGHKLYGRDEEIDRTYGGPLWKLDKKEARRQRKYFVGTQGLSPQRWQLWKQRFAAVEDCEKIDEATRNAAGDAIVTMSRIEDDVDGMQCDA